MAKRSKKVENEKCLPENAKDKIFLGNVEYKTHFTKKFKNKEKYKPKDPKKIYSFMPGTILGIDVKVGDEVKRGDSLFLLEAMKMKNRVLADLDGTIKKVHVNIGDRVSKNFLLIEMK